MDTNSSGTMFTKGSTPVLVLSANHPSTRPYTMMTLSPKVTRAVVCGALAVACIAPVAMAQTQRVESQAAATLGLSQALKSAPDNATDAKEPSSAAGPPVGGDVPAHTPLPPPTDIPPPDIPAPVPLKLGNVAIIRGALDLRSVSQDYGTRKFGYVREGEVSVVYPIVIRGLTRANAVVQGIYEDTGPSGKRNVTLGEAYVSYRLPTGKDSDSTAEITAGQFQVPFGLLGVYDPHLDVIQPLYAQSLGLRLDWGIGIAGQFYSVLNYNFALTAGVGPGRVAVPSNKVATLRLGRKFVTRNGSVIIGGSLLSGRLPITDIDAEHPFSEELPPSGRVISDRGYVQKTRIGVDGSLNYKKIVARGEAVTGADGDRKILGFFAQGEYKLTDRFTGLVARAYYMYPEGDSTNTRTAAGVVYSISPNATIRTVYEILADTPRDKPSDERRRFTAQVLLRF